jgi:hypothetical protein
MQRQGDKIKQLLKVLEWAIDRGRKKEKFLLQDGS